MRGLRVLLLDKGDIGGGTSSWSTRLIHGGLRYPEYAELRLVRESLRGRETLLKIAPHLVKPLKLLIPIYEHSRRGPLLMRLGMIAYDLLSIGKSLPGHQMLNTAAALAAAPGLNPQGLKGAAVFYDAQVEFAERLVVENVLSAVEHGAVVQTYARVTRLICDQQRPSGVAFVSEVTGITQTATAAFVINASGPWVDEILESGDSSERLIGGTKGSHIIVAPFAGAPTSALYVEAQTNRRPFFIIPWNANYLIGTTDIRYDGNLDDVRISEGEIHYLLRETNVVIPEAKLERQHILYSYSGIRPLPATNNADEQSITRRHFIRRHPRCENFLSIVGGKLTTYRSLAEEVVDLCVRRIGKGDQKSKTASKNLPGAEADAAALRARLREIEGLSLESVNHLVQVYGGNAGYVVSLATKDKSLLEVFDMESGAIAAEVVYAFQYELATTLSDVLLRRTMVGLNSALGVGADEAAALIGERHLGWSEERARQEVADYRSYIERFQA